MEIGTPVRELASEDPSASLECAVSAAPLALGDTRKLLVEAIKRTKMNLIDITRRGGSLYVNVQ